MSNKKIIPVTDHAIVRYFERIEGRDIDQIKKEINNPDLIEQFEVLGNGDYPVKNKYYARIRHKKVVTILPV